MDVINVAIVDDHTLFRRTLINYLSEQKNICVSVQASDSPELLNKLKTTPVDLLLMDIFLPPVDGVDALQLIRFEYPEMKILVISVCNELDNITDLLDLGINGFISRDDEPDDLINAIRAISENKVYHTRSFTEALFRTKQFNMNNETFRQASLNDREKKILQLLWEEKSNKDIADELFLSIRSVEKIRQDMKDKVGVKSTIGLIKYAVQKKIIGYGNGKRTVRVRE